MKLKPITKAPGAMLEIAKKINEVIAELEPLLNMTGEGVTVTRSPQNILFKVTDRGRLGGGGVPSGSTDNEIFRWDGTNWSRFQLPTAAGKRILGVRGGVMTMLETISCDELESP